MGKRSILRRIDEHMARGNELMDANRQAFEDLRATLRQINLRSDRFMTEHSQAITEQSRTLAEQSRTLIEQSRTLAELRADMRESRREFVEEMQAQRRALFAILDRFESGGATGTA